MRRPTWLSDFGFILIGAAGIAVCWVAIQVSQPFRRRRRAR